MRKEGYARNITPIFKSERTLLWASWKRFPASVLPSAYHSRIMYTVKCGILSFCRASAKLWRASRSMLLYVNIPRLQCITIRNNGFTSLLKGVWNNTVQTLFHAPHGGLLFIVTIVYHNILWMSIHFPHFFEDLRIAQI